MPKVKIKQPKRFSGFWVVTTILFAISTGVYGVLANRDAKFLECHRTELDDEGNEYCVTLTWLRYVPVEEE